MSCVAREGILYKELFGLRPSRAREEEYLEGMVSRRATARDAEVGKAGHLEEEKVN